MGFKPRFDIWSIFLLGSALWTLFNIAKTNNLKSERSISYATSWNTVAMIFCVLNVYLQTIISLAYLLILNAKSWVTEGRISPDCPQYSKTRPISTYLILSANTLCQYNAAWPILFELILFNILDRYNCV